MTSSIPAYAQRPADGVLFARKEGFALYLVMKSTAAPLKRGWHNTYDLHYHFVFTVKYRRSLLDEQVTAHLTRISQSIEDRHDIQIECLGTDQNHLHLLCGAPPDLAPSDIVRIYKSITARELFKALPLLRKELWGGAFWSSGFFVATVGQRGGYEAIKRYVQSQGQTPNEATLRLLFELTDEN